MAEWAGQLVGLIGFEVDRLAQRVDYTGRWADQVVEQLVEISDHTIHWVGLG